MIYRLLHTSPTELWLAVNNILFLEMAGIFHGLCLENNKTFHSLVYCSCVEFFLFPFPYTDKDTSQRVLVMCNKNEGRKIFLLCFHPSQQQGIKCNKCSYIVHSHYLHKQSHSAPSTFSFPYLSPY